MTFCQALFGLAPPTGLPPTAEDVVDLRELPLEFGQWLVERMAAEDSGIVSERLLECWRELGPISASALRRVFLESVAELAGARVLEIGEDSGVLVLDSKP